MKIIQQRQRKSYNRFTRMFCWAGQEDKFCGFCFECDENGVPKLNNDCAKANYEACLEGEVDGQKVIDQGIHKETICYTEPKIGLCRCGTEVYLDRFTNTCDNCGTDYNSAGQELAPREQWGEETGECLADIFMADVDPFSD